MNRAPEFLPYPRVPAPAYSSWRASGVVLLAVTSSASVLVGSQVDTQWIAASMVAVLLLWTLALMLRVLWFRLNRHNAQCYAEATHQVQQAWWARQRQKVALLESVLVGPACSEAAHRHALLSPDHPSPPSQIEPDGPAIRMSRISASLPMDRERELARLLAMQWQLQRKDTASLQPLRCYWQGSQQAWQAFAEHMAEHCPHVVLPEQPEPWLGINSLDAIIDRLHAAKQDARILCAGCQSSPADPAHHLPAGEAAVLWLLGRQGGPRISRLQGWAADTEPFATVAERALQQSEQLAPPEHCVLFSQATAADLSATGWNIRQQIQDAHFGALANLESMVAQTLAACCVEHHGAPCAWLANDPHHTVAFGIVESDDTNN